MGWLGLAALHLAFPAEPWSDRTWFFNPFGWQLIFFTGFALHARMAPAAARPRLADRAGGPATYFALVVACVLRQRPTAALPDRRSAPPRPATGTSRNPRLAAGERRVVRQVRFRASALPALPRAGLRRLGRLRGGRTPPDRYWPRGCRAAGRDPSRSHEGRSAESRRSSSSRWSWRGSMASCST